MKRRSDFGSGWLIEPVSGQKPPDDRHELETGNGAFAGLTEGATIRKGSAYARSLERAIRAKCLDCCGGSRAEVRGCGIKYCSLWPYRTANDGASGESRSPAKESAGTDTLSGQMNISDFVGR